MLDQNKEQNSSEPVIEGLMTDEEIKISKLPEKPEFMSSMDLAKETFEKNFKEFEKSEQYKLLCDQNKDVLDEIDCTNIPLDIAQDICFKNGVEVFKHNIIDSKNKWGYYFEFSDSAMFNMFKNRIEKECVIRRSKKNRTDQES